MIKILTKALIMSVSLCTSVGLCAEEKPSIDWYKQTKLQIVQVGNPVLRERARELSREEILSPDIQNLIEIMKNTMRGVGVGLAAPQVGLPLRIAVIEDLEEYHGRLSAEALKSREREPVPFHVIINPKITIDESETREFHEGCLSVAGLTGIVPRARRVRVECLNEKAEPVVIDASGWYARILQHEIDHLDEILYLDRVQTKSLSTLENYVKYGHNQPNK